MELKNVKNGIYFLVAKGENVQYSEYFVVLRLAEYSGREHVEQGQYVGRH